MYSSAYLVKDGRSPYRIVIPEDASSVIRFAAGELQMFFREATGITLPVEGDEGESFDEDAYVFVRRRHFRISRKRRGSLLRRTRSRRIAVGDERECGRHGRVRRKRRHVRHVRVPGALFRVGKCTPKTNMRSKRRKGINGSSSSRRHGASRIRPPLGGLASLQRQCDVSAAACGRNCTTTAGSIGVILISRSCPKRNTKRRIPIGTVPTVRSFV